MPDIRYLIKIINGVPVLAPPTEIDITTSDELRSVLLGLAAGKHATVIVDMTGTRFCDSAGFRELIRAHKRVLCDGGELRLVAPASGAVARVIALIRLDLLIPTFASLDEALTARSAAVVVPFRRPRSPKPGSPADNSSPPAKGA